MRPERRGVPGRVMEQVHLRGLQGPRYIVMLDFNYRYWGPVGADLTLG